MLCFVVGLLMTVCETVARLRTVPASTKWTVMVIVVASVPKCHFLPPNQLKVVSPSLSFELQRTSYGPRRWPQSGICDAYEDPP